MGFRITALKAQKKNSHRVNVYLDGRYAFGIHRNIAADLSIGQELTDESINTLLQKDAEETAFHRAIQYIHYRDRSEYEITQYLEKSGVAPDTISKVLERLNYLELTNDKKFAENWVENRIDFRPRSRRMLAMELRNKGVSNEVITQVLQTMPSEEELAFHCAKKQACRYFGLSRQDFYRKLSNYLSRRGFSYDVISPVIEWIWKTSQNSEGEL